MNNNKITIIFLSLIYISALAIYWLGLGFSIIPLREGIYLSTSLIAVIAGTAAIRSYGLNGPRILTLVFLTAGITYWFVGDTLFDYYQYVLHIDPFPSAADIFYTLAYPLLFLGLISEARIFQINWRKLNKSTIFLFVIASVCLAAMVFYFGMYRAYNPQESLFANVIAMGYGGGDLLLIMANMLILILVWEFRGGSLTRVWVALFISFIFTLVADVLYAIYTGEYESQVWFYKSLLDTLWMSGYLLFAYALFSYRFSITDAYAQIKKISKKEEKEN
jgi:hypothetical protein